MFHLNWQGVVRAMFAAAVVVMCGMAANAATQDAGKPATANAPLPTAIQTAKRVFLGMQVSTSHRLRLSGTLAV